MISELIQLIVLFFVIFDPFASFAVFSVATAKMNRAEKVKTALYALLVASALSLAVLVFGSELLELFNTTIKEFSIAGGIILGILGIKMALGHSLTDIEKLKNDSGMAIAAIIGTPLLTGPAAISAIIISVQNNGMLLTGAAVAFVLVISGVLLLLSDFITKILGKTLIQVTSTILGLITLSWGVKFIFSGLA